MTVKTLDLGIAIKLEKMNMTVKTLDLVYCYEIGKITWQ